MAEGQRAGPWEGVRSGSREVARRPVAGRDLAPLWRHFAADRVRQRAPRVEPARRWRIDRRGDVARKDDPLTLALDHRIGDRDRREQRLGVGVQWVLVEVVAV